MVTHDPFPFCCSVILSQKTIDRVGGDLTFQRSRYLLGELRSHLTTDPLITQDDDTLGIASNWLLKFEQATFPELTVQSVFEPHRRVTLVHLPASASEGGPGMIQICGHDVPIWQALPDDRLGEAAVQTSQALRRVH
ncbi:hypothetical protein [Actinomadura gamaensis]|uniref:Uncharacterized protein n=1 Tax=Actinomadura gamaensis TaxID=1763541 RepID=A0ABV9UB99_9ACTN